MAKLYFFIISVFVSVGHLQSQICYGQDSQLQFHQIPDTDVTFSNQNQLLQDIQFSSVLIVGVADMNNDKLDDIIRLENGRFLQVEFQNIDGQFSTLEFGEISQSQQWSMAVADVDNNGFNDLLISGNDDGVKLLSNIDGTQFEETILPESIFFAQGANCADINMDGNIDVFVCDDEGLNKIWAGSGDGVFTTAFDWIDMSTTPPSDNSGNYASSFTDVDNDGDLDLYISKCSINAPDDPTDPRRVNQLFINDGNANYTEDGAARGMNNGAQSWTTDFQDIDNDGDLDAFIINHDSICQLMLNDGQGYFSDITLSSGVDIENYPLQGIMRDFDNDGWVDILVAGNNGYLFYENQGNAMFAQVGELFGSYSMGTFSIGDLNHDGFLDVYSGSPLSNDILWINEKNANNFFAVNLKSGPGNPNAIGARLEIYGEWGIQIREVRSGESYGIMNSYTQHFGLGTSTIIDSLVIRWPSGMIETYEQPTVNQFLNVVEGDCAYPDCFIQAASYSFCTGDTIVLSAPEGVSYLWSDNSTEQELFVTEGGIYQVTVTNAYGCSVVSNTIEIIQDPDEDISIEISSNTPPVVCAGTTVFLFASDAENYTWSTGSETASIVVLESGTYWVLTEGVCTAASDTLDIEIVQAPDNPMIENDTIYDDNLPDTGTLMASGMAVQWFENSSGGMPLAFGNVFVTPPLLETTMYFAQDFFEVNDSLTCKSQRVPVSVILELVDDVEDLASNENIVIFPNPAQQIVFIRNHNPNAIKIEDVKLYNQIGAEIAVEYDLSNNELIAVSIDNLISGTYVLALDTTNGWVMRKFLVKK